MIKWVICSQLNSTSYPDLYFQRSSFTTTDKKSDTLLVYKECDLCFSWLVFFMGFYKKLVLILLNEYLWSFCYFFVRRTTIFFNCRAHNYFTQVVYIISSVDLLFFLLLGYLDFY